MARPESEPATPLAERLRRVRSHLGNVDRDLFAKEVGIGKSTLAHYERGDRTPDASMLALYQKRLGINLNWLVSGDGDMFGRQASQSQSMTTLSQRDHDDTPATMIRLPVYSEVMASAGPGAAPVSELADGVISFEPLFLRNHGATPERCVVIWARGDSMMPTIPNGAALVVDQSQTEISNGCIMVIGVGDDLLVKRIRRRLDGLIDLMSDNSAYPPETLGPDALRQLRVVGRVVYFCRTP